ncbi:hypothetical protein ABGV03_004912 [Escherichia coli]
MARKLKPLSRGERAVVRQLAYCLVLADIEQNAIACAYEQQTGKPWNPDAPDIRHSFCRRNLWRLPTDGIRDSYR